MGERELWTIIAPHFCASVVVRDGRVTKPAPILKYMLGWTPERIAEYCHRKGWTIERQELDGEPTWGADEPKGCLPLVSL